MNQFPPPPRGQIRDPRVPSLFTYRGALEDPDRHLAYTWAGTLLADMKVLDLGCGTGEGSVALIDSGVETVVGVDHRHLLIDEATRVHGERCRFIYADTSSTGLETGSFDAVCCFGLPDDGGEVTALLGEASRLLVEGGLLLTSLRSGNQIDPSLFDRFTNHSIFELAFTATVSPAGGSATAGEGVGGNAPVEAGATEADFPDNASPPQFIAASDGEIPPAAMTLRISPAEIALYQDSLRSWEDRARRAEAEGSAKHWELVAAREAQRRLRKRLHVLEHRPLRILSRVVRGKQAKLGPGPPLRPSDMPSDPRD